MSHKFGIVLELAKDDDAFVEQFIARSAEDLLSYLSGVKDAIANENLHWLLFIRHKSKSLFDLLGDHTVSENLSAIVEMAMNNQWQMGYRVDQLETDIHALINTIQTALKTQEV